ncbi:MAG: Rieske (2Fe-2S) protein [Pseudomonadota bacterium]
MSNRSLLDDFDAGGKLAHGLPGEAYVSESFMQMEHQFLFNNHWVFVGYAHQMTKPGDVKPIEVAGLPLFLLRDQNDRITAFHNVCRHRNLKLIDSPGNCGKLIRCPYHSWSYDLCGSLKNAPFFGGGIKEVPTDFSLEDNGLMPVNWSGK